MAAGLFSLINIVKEKVRLMELLQKYVGRSWKFFFLQAEISKLYKRFKGGLKVVLKTKLNETKHHTNI